MTHIDDLNQLLQRITEELDTHDRLTMHAALWMNHHAPAFPQHRQAQP